MIIFKRFAHPAGPTQDASFEPRAYKPRAEKENKAKLVAAFEPRAYKPRADWKKVARLERPYQKHNVFLQIFCEREPLKKGTTGIGEPPGGVIFGPGAPPKVT